jgi:hypothetical protein
MPEYSALQIQWILTSLLRRFGSLSCQHGVHLDPFVSEWVPWWASCPSHILPFPSVRFMGATLPKQKINLWCADSKFSCWQCPCLCEVLDCHLSFNSTLWPLDYVDMSLYRDILRSLICLLNCPCLQLFIDISLLPWNLCGHHCIQSLSDLLSVVCRCVQFLPDLLAIVRSKDCLHYISIHQIQHCCNSPGQFRLIVLRPCVLLSDCSLCDFFQNVIQLDQHPSGR